MSFGFSVHVELYDATLLLNYIYVAHIAHPYEYHSQLSEKHYLLH